MSPQQGFLRPGGLTNGQRALSPPRGFDAATEMSENTAARAKAMRADTAPGLSDPAGTPGRREPCSEARPDMSKYRWPGHPAQAA